MVIMTKKERKELSRIRNIANNRLKTFSRQREKTFEYMDFVDDLKKSGYGYYDRKKKSWQIKSIRGFGDRTLDKLKFNADRFITSERPIDVRRPKKYDQYTDRNYIAERIRDKTNDPYKVLYFIELTGNNDDYRTLLETEQRALNAADNDAQEYLAEKEFEYYESLFD